MSKSQATAAALMLAVAGCAHTSSGSAGAAARGSMAPTDRPSTVSSSQSPFLTWKPVFTLVSVACTVILLEVRSLVPGS